MRRPDALSRGPVPAAALIECPHPHKKGRWAGSERRAQTASAVCYFVLVYVCARNPNNPTLATHNPSRVNVTYEIRTRAGKSHSLSRRAP
eukprot:scaffold2643_cov387-Prasinococcus_capsulatus_cf.AAC.9